MHRLIALPRETDWVEFKENFFKAEDIGQYISALANSAALGSQGGGGRPSTPAWHERRRDGWSARRR
ncbi:hypothetical protein AMK34_21875 [Amycolatopsis sp. CB00013]|nr:hypothetical protein AMK34_21875 [Amycolatopsis sp. CB00013]